MEFIESRGVSTGAWRGEVSPGLRPMTDRDASAAPRPPDDPLGGMTGATGNLVPDDPDEEFVPAETREISDPRAARSGTAAATAPDDRDGGHGPESTPREARIGGDELSAEEDRL